MSRLASQEREFSIPILSRSAFLYKICVPAFLKRRERETRNARPSLDIIIEEKAKVVASDWGQNLFNSLPRQLVCLGLFERKGRGHPIFPHNEDVAAQHCCSGLQMMQMPLWRGTVVDISLACDISMARRRFFTFFGYQNKKIKKISKALKFSSFCTNLCLKKVNNFFFKY